MSNTVFQYASLLVMPAMVAAMNGATAYAAEAEMQSHDADRLLDEVVVTARKREERTLDVPVSLGVVTGLAIDAQRLQDATDLVATTPNLYLSSNPQSPGRDFVNLVIRGIGAQSEGNPAVATIVDGVYVPSLAFDTAFIDIDRIEILRGPQGTLFGRNTQGGAVNIVVRRPDASTRAKVALTYDDFDTVRGQASVAGPLADRFYGALATDLQRSDGYVRNRRLNPDGSSFFVKGDDFRSVAARGALRWNPSPQLDVNLSFDGSERKGLDGLPGMPRGRRDYVIDTEFSIDAEYENQGAALNVDYSFATARLTSVTGYRYLTASLPFDFDGGADYSNNIHDLKSRQEIVSQEIRLAGEAVGDRLNWLIGAYGFSERHVQLRRYQLAEVAVFPSGIFITAQDQDLRRSGGAMFGDVVYNLTDRLELGVGVRWSEETAKSHFFLDFTIPDLFGPGIPLGLVEEDRQRVTDSQITSTATLAYRWTDAVSSYFRYAEGYKAGGFPLAPGGSASNVAFKPEQSQNFEIGAKTELLQGRLRLDLSAFYVPIRDQQLATIAFFNDDPNLPVIVVGNAGKSRSRGFEFELVARPVPAFELSAGVGYTDATYTSYIDTIGDDRAGERFPYTPEWTTRVAAQYTVQLRGDLSLTGFGSYRSVSSILSGSGVDIDVQFKVPSYDVLDLGVTLAARRWKFDVFADNVFDSFIETRVWNAFFFPPERPFSIAAPPRRIGGRVTYEF